LSRTVVTPWSGVLGKKFPESHLIPELEVRCPVLVTKCNSGDHINNNKDGRACGACGEDEKYIEGVGGKLGVGGILLKWILKEK